MKKIFAFAFGLMVLLSCTNEDSHTTMNTDANSAIKMKSLRDRVGLLYTYSTATDCYDKTKQAFMDLTNESKLELTTLTGVSHIFYRVKVGNNEVLLTEIHYIDVVRNQVVESFILNPATGDLDSIGGGDPVYEPLSGEPVYSFIQLTGMCPDGMDLIGGCFDQGDTLAYNTCVGQMVAAYHLSNSVVGDVGTYSTIVGSGSTLVCGMITNL